MEITQSDLLGFMDKNSVKLFYQFLQRKLNTTNKVWIEIKDLDKDSLEGEIV